MSIGRYCRRLAELMIRHSLAVEPGQQVLLIAPAIAEPLVREVVRAVEAGGGIPIALAQPPPDTNHDALEHLFDSITRVSACVFTEPIGSAFPEQPAGTTPSLARLQELLARSAAGELAWVTTLFPAEDGTDANQHDEELLYLLWKASFLDQADAAACWLQQKARQEELCGRLASADRLHFRTPHGTDLQVNVAGRTWVNSAGSRNLPDGEVFTGPQQPGTEGVVIYPGRITIGGRPVSDLKLTILDGQAVEVTASEGRDWVERLLNLDDGASAIGEIGLGCNRAIAGLTGYPLIDEKMAGTFHLGLGMSYPETGATNRSVLHLDLVCDLRGGGSVDADELALYADGKFCPFAKL